MPGSVYDGATWRTIAALWVYDGATWRSVSTAAVYDGATWRTFFTAGGEPYFDSVTAWVACVQCDKASPGCDFRAYATVNLTYWDSGTYRVDCLYRGAADEGSCTSSYTTFASDISVNGTTGQTATQEDNTTWADYEYFTPNENNPCYQWKFEIRKRSDSSLIDDIISSCTCEDVAACLA